MAEKADGPAAAATAATGQGDLGMHHRTEDISLWQLIRTVRVMARSWHIERLFLAGLTQEPAAGLEAVKRHRISERHFVFPHARYYEAIRTLAAQGTPITVERLCHIVPHGSESVRNTLTHLSELRVGPAELGGLARRVTDRHRRQKSLWAVHIYVHLEESTKFLSEILACGDGIVEQIGNEEVVRGRRMRAREHNRP